jgi:hypothetical protein
MYICFRFNVEVTSSSACYEHIVELNIHAFSSINFLKLMNSIHILLLVQNLECAPTFVVGFIMMLFDFLDVHVLSNM